jgi:lactoylglutathione lyase
MTVLLVNQVGYIVAVDGVVQLAIRVAANNHRMIACVTKVRLSRTMDAVQIEHVGIWVRDLERMRQFYLASLGARSSERYENPRTDFRSYFISFGNGARIELMSRPVGQTEGRSEPSAFGYAHVALRLGSQAAVEEMVIHLETQGGVVLSRPRVTGDGYYEAAVEDPEGNRIELVA